MENKVYQAHSGFIQAVLAKTAEKALADCPPSLLPGLSHHLEGMRSSKGWRIALVKAAAELKQAPFSLDQLLSLGVTASLLHEVSLIFDDLLDRDLERRGKLALWQFVGEKRAGFIGAWLLAKALEGNSHLASVVRGIELLDKRVIEGEAAQEALSRGPRPTPLPVWERLALLDTGSFFFFPFEVLGLAGDWREWINRLALLYHGLDDLEDLLGKGSLAGGGRADLRDEVPTLPTCFTSSRLEEDLRKAAWDGWFYLVSLLPGEEKKIPAPLRPFFSDLASALHEVNHLLLEKGGLFEDPLPPPAV